MPGSEHISPVCSAASYPAPSIAAAAAAAAGSLAVNDVGEEDATLDATTAAELATVGGPEMDAEEPADVKIEDDDGAEQPPVSEQG